MTGMRTEGTSRNSWIGLGEAGGLLFSVVATRPYFFLHQPDVMRLCFQLFDGPVKVNLNRGGLSALFE